MKYPQLVFEFKMLFPIAICLKKISNVAYREWHFFIATKKYIEVSTWLSGI
jgi:hypothetical protein